MNGFGLTSKIRADKTMAELPVVLVTALESRSDRGARHRRRRQRLLGQEQLRPKQPSRDHPTADMNAPNGKPIKVLIVEDSGVVAKFLTHVFESDPALEVVGVATDGDQALDAVKRTHPDVVTMDIHMPRLNGFEATRSIMESCPTPIVIVSGSYDPDEVATNFEALEAGALAIIARPNGLGHDGQASSTAELIRTIKLMSEVKVVKRWHRRRPLPVLTQSGPIRAIPTPSAVQVVAIGASTGGPLILQTFCPDCPRISRSRS